MDAPAPAQTPRIEIVGRLSPGEIDAVTWLIEAATNADGVAPVSEHVALHLTHGGDAPGRNVLLWAGPAGGEPTLVAYAHLDVTDAVEGASAEVVVHPAARRQGYGRALLETALHETRDGRLRLWAHGRLPGAQALAASLGFEQIRELRQLRRPLTQPVPEPELPPGVLVRTFRPGDEDAWVALNARAFAAHPEQGSWSREDLDLRLAESWFDPAGLFLAERDGRLVGFHWTKVHGGSDDDHGHSPIGEVYVLGVDPTEQGNGLGRALALVGLRHLRERGLPTAMLYVDADNPGALRLYERLGFTTYDIDVVFRRGQRR